MPRISFFTPYRLPSLNIQQNLHWAARSKERELVEAEIQLVLRCNRIMETHKDRKAHVTITRLWGGKQKEMDVSNIYLKHCLDALVSQKLLKDDAPGWCICTVEQEKSTYQGTKVEIEYETK